MRRARLFAILGVLAVGFALALGVSDCAEATQIQIDVRTDGCRVVKNTGIAVTTPDRIDEADLTIFTPRAEGCEAKPEDRVGTLVVYPSGAKDAEIGVRIVTGVSRTAQECAKGPYDGCIVARRVLRFVPGTSQKVIVIMSRACEGKDCGPGNECTEGGQCVTVLPDGGTAEAGPNDAGSPNDDGGSAVADAGGADACAGCPGTCTGGRACTIDCGSVDCKGETLCGPDLDCTFACPTTDACKDTRCVAPDGGCSFDCTSGGACDDVTCVSERCYFRCNGGQACSGVIQMSGGDAGMTCTGGNSCNDADLFCDAGHCALSCNAQGGGQNCPDPRKCSGGPARCDGPWQP